MEGYYVENRIHFLPLMHESSDGEMDVNFSQIP